MSVNRQDTSLSGLVAAAAQLKIVGTDGCVHPHYQGQAPYGAPNPTMGTLPLDLEPGMEVAAPYFFMGGVPQYSAANAGPIAPNGFHQPPPPPHPSLPISGHHHHQPYPSMAPGYHLNGHQYPSHGLVLQTAQQYAEGGPKDINFAHQQQSLGWGGQAIQDASGFRAPWFGKSRGRGGPHRANGNGNQRDNGRARGRGRGGRNGTGNSNGNRAPRRLWNEGMEDGNNMEDSVESLVALVRGVAPGKPLTDVVYQALFRLEGRSCALLLKELARAGLHRRASELFEWVRALEDGHPLQSLLDVYSYTAAISLCIATRDIDLAMSLASEMKCQGIECNVHTYTAMMNVCIKCNRHSLALETYRLMRADGCIPNVVTYNTLIDAHGKMGVWEEAVAVLGTMKVEGVEPVLRTYNTLLIACNMCSQPRESMAIYRRMIEEGFQPNSTTYNALISAYGKTGQLERVMEIFQEMMYRGCERSVITYSSLISACERAGQWEMALELFQEMIREHCQPNTVTFNSLITALGQGGQWEKAHDVFEQMRAQGCTPDVVTYTALIAALEKGGQWRLALGAFESMRRQGCRADAIVYNAIIDALWETGAVWAQRKALTLFRTAIEEGHFAQAHLSPGLARGEVNLHALTAGVAMLCLYAWMISLKQLVVAHGSAAVPARLAIVTDRGRSAKEQGNLVVKEAVAALMTRWGAPFKPAAPVTNSSESSASSNGNGNGNGHSNGNGSGMSGLLEAAGLEIAAWILSDAFEAQLFAFFPCTDCVTSVASSRQTAGSLLAVGSLLDDPGHQKEVAVEQRCSEAFAAVRLFEKTHCLALQNMDYSFLQRRPELVSRCADMAAALGVLAEAGHDAVLLMDRVMSTSLALEPQLLDLLVAACVVIAAKQVDGAAAAFGVPMDLNLSSETGLPSAAVDQMEWNVRQVLNNDTASISSLRCLKLYLERLGAHHMDDLSATAMAGSSAELVDKALTDVAFLNCRPSVIAAAILYVDRRARGVIPFWPTMLAKLTGYHDMSTPELSVAIKAAQKLCGRGHQHSGNGSSSPSSSCSSLRKSSDTSSNNGAPSVPAKLDTTPLQRPNHAAPAIVTATTTGPPLASDIFALKATAPGNELYQIRLQSIQGMAGGASTSSLSSLATSSVSMSIASGVSSSSSSGVHVNASGPMPFQAMMGLSAAEQAVLLALQRQTRIASLPAVEASRGGGRGVTTAVGSASRLVDGFVNLPTVDAPILLSRMLDDSGSGSGSGRRDCDQSSGNGSSNGEAYVDGLNSDAIAASETFPPAYMMQTSN